MVGKQNSAPCGVLIVDESADSRQVLRTALQRRGVTTWETAEGETALRLARQHRPQVIVLDVDADEAGEGVYDQFADHARGGESSLVLLGTARRRGDRDNGEFIAKPYQYGPLIHRIEQLLEQAISSRRRIG